MKKALIFYIILIGCNIGTSLTIDAGKSQISDFAYQDASIEEAKVMDVSVPDVVNKNVIPGMVKVSGMYCPEVEQVCLKWLDTNTDPKANGGIGPMRCAEFKYPAKCLSEKRKYLDFYMDEFEYPGEGQYPIVGMDYYQAKSIAEKAGKRLCTTEEFNFACEGPFEDPHPYGYGDGYHRDANICNIDKEWRDYNKFPRNTWNLHYDGGINQSVVSDRNSKCKSYFGVFNLNGNVDEILDSEKSKNVNLKGGYFGPIRARCRPETNSHDKTHSFYQLGFRMCKST